jgi:hypothetical protein
MDNILYKKGFNVQDMIHYPFREAAAYRAAHARKELI